MKITNVTLTAMALLTPFLFAEKGHEGHDHDNHADATHDHVKNIAGPNGGKVFTSSEPHFEFFVTEERKIRLTFLDKDNKAAATPEGAAASAVGGERSAPTKIVFEKDGETLLSDKPLPEGMDVPLILQVKPAADADNVTERFNVNLADCPTCEHREYACVCEHE